MKTLIYLMMLLPLFCLSQNTEPSQAEPLVIATMLIAPQPGEIAAFKEGMQSHNNRFHDNGAMGVRIYQVLNGPNAEKYMAVMGPMPWSALDTPITGEDHESDWYDNVIPYMKDETDVNYWRFDAKNSHFPENFEINKLEVLTIDIKRGEQEAMQKGIETISQVFKEKYPDLPIGFYTNEFGSTKDGRDFSVVYFFDDFAWLGEDSKMKDRFNEVHGEGGYEQFMKDWLELSEGAQTEIWIYNEELSGLGPQVTTSTRD